MKIMRLSSGLGNAMFQYAAYLQLKKMYPDEEVYLDTIWYDYTGYPQGGGCVNVLHKKEMGTLCS